jgi:hypothetical protein
VFSRRGSPLRIKIKTLYFEFLNQRCTRGIWGGGGGKGKGRLLSKSFTNFVNKNAIKPEKGVPCPKNFHNPFILYKY